MKNLILSIVVVGLIIWGGYYLFKDDKSSQNNSGLATSTDLYSTSTPVFEDGTLPAEDNVQTSTEQNKKTHMITIETNYGKIVFETYEADAPNTVKNFITLADKGFYNGLTFHRVIKGFMIQGGDPNGNGTGGPGYKFDDELNPNTPSYKAGYKKGVVAMANAGPNTNGSQFFIMHADYPLPNSYTIFGKVVSGQDVVDKIANVTVGANDKPITSVVMKTVTTK
ncbi:MAG: peptidyl-prolyl cis-trans isomerase-like 1 [Parcubacteria group bacterium Gr01-1014_46]|nr:MAG: peptidyl-prolyl cis-trans isomerase-like 1 [Parcubacteria group bacterium Gr01-1014_46]